MYMCVYMPALWCCFPPSVFIFVFRFARVFAKDESIFVSSGEYLCGWTLLVKLCAIMGDQMRTNYSWANSSYYIPGIQLNFCIECVHGRFYQQAKIVHLNFGFVLFLPLKPVPTTDPSRCEWVSKWGTRARAHKHKHLRIPSTRF